VTTPWRHADGQRNDALEQCSFTGSQTRPTLSQVHWSHA